MICKTRWVKDLNTTLNWLILIELPSLKCMDVWKCWVISISDLVRDVHLVIIDSVDNTICSLWTKDNDEFCVTSHLIRADELIYSLIRCNYSLCVIKVNRTDRLWCLIAVIYRCNLTNKIRITKDSYSYIRIIKNLEKLCYL